MCMNFFCLFVCVESTELQILCIYKLNTRLFSFLFRCAVFHLIIYLLINAGFFFLISKLIISLQYVYTTSFSVFSNGDLH